MDDYRALLSLSDAALAGLDVAAVNLACAAGLPGAGRIDAAGCVRTLDAWAGLVRRVTDRDLAAEFRGDPARYDRSEPLFRMVTLVHVLRACGVRYDPARRAAGPGDPFETGGQFVHGAIQGPGGTCASLPVVYAAVGRRVGYPVRLAEARGHVFCRWDDPATGVRVNVEGTRDDGVNAHPDDHYRRWPARLSAADEAAYGYLASLTPRREVAHFLGHRGAVWADAGADLRAVDAYHAASVADRPFVRYQAEVGRVVRRWGARLRAAGRIGAGFWYAAAPRGPRRWPGMPWAVEAEVLALDAAGRGGR